MKRVMPHLGHQKIISTKGILLVVIILNILYLLCSVFGRGLGIPWKVIVIVLRNVCEKVNKSRRRSRRGGSMGSDSPKVPSTHVLHFLRFQSTAEC